jgi:DNA invertase Pin-like site-specific DNA recombinase
MKRFITYYRVSTQKQGVSGLGLEAQQMTAQTFAKGRGEIVAEVVEVETGTKKRQRPKLAEAIERARSEGCCLLIAKIDRLARNAAFIFALRDSGVDFVACDCPEMNLLTVGVLAVVAQAEAETISARTKAALAARRARGLPLGTPANLTPEAARKGPEALKTQARENMANKQAGELAGLYRAQGLSLREIADRLNRGGYKTRGGKSFQAESVRRVLAIAAA